MMSAAVGSVKTRMSQSRREFITNCVAASAAVAATGFAQESANQAKIKVGIVGGGDRGHLIGDCMRSHGGFEICAVADYFQDLADKLGEKYGVPAARRYTGIQGHKRMLESGGIDAIALLNVPYFFPQQSADAVAAGKHIYVAKPIATDVPGTLRMGELAKQCTANKKVMLVDLQLPDEPANQEVLQRIHKGALGQICHGISYGYPFAFPDLPNKPVEPLLRGYKWASDTALSGDTFVHFDIHAIDGMYMARGKAPVSAMGVSGIKRPNPKGDRVDFANIIYAFDDGSCWTHMTQGMGNNVTYKDLDFELYGTEASAHLCYTGKPFIRGGSMSGALKTSDACYNEGAARSVAKFHAYITGAHYENEIVARAVQGVLVAILGREAAARKAHLTLEQVIKENRKWEVDLDGLKA